MLDRTIQPPVSDFPEMSIPEPSETTLSNGVRLVTLNQGDDEINNILVMWNGGICESDNFSAPKLSDMTLNEATINRSSEEIASDIEFNGSWLAIKSHLHHSTVSLHSLNSRLSKVLPILTDIICNPTFPDDIIEIKRKKLLSATELDNKKVSFRASTLIKQQIYGKNHPVAFNDTQESINDVTRQLLIDHHNIIFRSAPTLFVSGRITPEAERLITETFENINFNKPAVDLNIKQLSPDYSTQLKIDSIPDKLQSAVNIAIPVIDRNHPDYDSLRIATTALGGYFGSRLMANIREEKGYTYGINAGVMGTHEGAYIGITCECANEYVKPVIEEVKNEIGKLASELMCDSELTAVKRYMQSSLASTLDNPFSVIDYYVKKQIVGIPDGYFYRQQRAIKEVTPEKIREMATTYMDPDKMLISVAGDPVIQ